MMPTMNPYEYDDEPEWQDRQADYAVEAEAAEAAALDAYAEWADKVFAEWCADEGVEPTEANREAWEDAQMERAVTYLESLADGW